jgi:hypothetical protein
LLSALLHPAPHRGPAGHHTAGRWVQQSAQQSESTVCASNASASRRHESSCNNLRAPAKRVPGADGSAPGVGVRRPVGGGCSPGFRCRANRAQWRGHAGGARSVAMCRRGRTCASRARRRREGGATRPTAPYADSLRRLTAPTHCAST